MFLKGDFMNFLARVKSCNRYDLVLDNLSHASGTEPIVAPDGTTLLLLDDGTSWEFMDGEWQQIELCLDEQILNGFYPFLTSICNSIDNNDFVKMQLSEIYQGVGMSLAENIVTLSNLSEIPKIQSNDFVIIADYVKKYTTGDTVNWEACWDRRIECLEDLYGITLPTEPIELLNLYLTTVTAVTDTSISIDNKGADIRITSGGKTIGVFFVSFPPDFMTMAIQMFGYDLFYRDSKEKRQERLGNYTYTNFEPIQYYGTGSYPKDLEDKIKYYQEVHV